METTFHNVMITLEAETPKEAYNRLCELLGAKYQVDWDTDMYTVYDKESDDVERPTDELFPTEEDSHG